jgi:hypothetical protein
MNVIELSRIRREIEDMADFCKAIGLHPSQYMTQLREIEVAAVQKAISSNRQMVIEFNRNGSDAMSQRWDCSRRTAFRIRDRAAKECHLVQPA